MMDTGLQQGTGCGFCLEVFWLEVRDEIIGCRRLERSSAEHLHTPERYVIDTILADGVDHLGMLGFRLRRLSSIRFERCTPSLSSSADLRLHRTFV
ncbi:hypothetical protein L6452_13903 [Arctium lappa]|uniref:Uncharacterized protein n=1 Tax=Arctium lappa TaxID=4217 RepID=A0ACB9CJT6_ARCLA|nr:hypothetical protein L6452_13903 [Arctium lappa]